MKQWGAFFRTFVAAAALALITISVKPEILSAGPEPEPCSLTLGWCCDCWIQGATNRCEKLFTGTGVEACSLSPWNCPSNPDNWCYT